MDNATLITDAELNVAPTYGRYPIALVRGEGCRVWDADGKALNLDPDDEIAAGCVIARDGEIVNETIANL